MIPTQPGPIGTTPALLIIDPQYDFLDPDGAVYCPCSSVESTAQVAENIRTVAAAARKADLPVIWTKESHRTDRSDYGAELLSVERDHTLAGTEGEQFLSTFSVADGFPPAEYLVRKRRYNCFHNTDLEHLLSTFDIDTLLLAGVTTNVCVHYTAQGAHERDYVFRVVEECTAGTSRSLHDAALEMLEYLQPDSVQSLDAVTDALADYDGNETVERVKRTGSVVDLER
ncbi:cysteine hydrolase family protein [Natrinema marinum]|uniref:cysteine hydrolase family protein n=1 Tax=Natrinema marinum TaxID=2961598 RepID=UPI0020C9222D|nr:isochorismatase family cysteine hydrolase [Natrinema marinum]